MTALDDFIADARKIPLEDVFDIVGGVRRKANISGEEVGPCPCCFGGGKDRFSINVGRQVWSCRHYDRQGGDGLELMAHKEGLDLRRRAEFLLACSLVQGGRPVPAGGEQESDDERAAREKRNADRKAAAEAERARKAEFGERERAKAISQGRGIYLAGVDGSGTAAEDYLMARIGRVTIPVTLWENLRFHPSLTYWHGTDDRGHARELHCGPALVAPMVDPVGEPGRITGCHMTWIDLDASPKCRPVLVDDAGEKLPTKKMRGHKTGSIIPVLGDIDAARWVAAEGIENVLAAAAFEGFRADTFYFAAGDIGNLAGPAVKSIAHPTLRKQDVKGHWRAVMVPGPEPRPGREDDCFQLPAHVVALTLVGDRDSEAFFTVNAMLRAELRLARDGLDIRTEWPPPPFSDFSEFHLSYAGAAA